MKDVAVDIGNGNHSVSIDESAKDEMGTQAKEFNQMADSLNEKISQLEQANRNLEIRVSECTEEFAQTKAQLLEAQKQLVRSDRKNSAIGELSASVAHDLRNSLNTIRAGVYFLKKRLAKSDKLSTETRVVETLELMDESVTQCDGIVGILVSQVVYDYVV